MLECPTVPSIFLNTHMRNYRKRAFGKCCPGTVLLGTRKESQLSCFEKTEIYNTPVRFSPISGISPASTEVQSTSPKRQARVLPNILRNSLSKTQLESETSLPMAETNSISGQAVILERLQGSMEVDTAGSRKQSRKRKQDYKQANIRQDPSDSLDVEGITDTAGMQRETGSKRARLSMEKKMEKEMLKSKQSGLSENTEVFQNNTLLAVPESEMLVCDACSSIDQFPYPNEYSFFQEKEETNYNEFIDFSSNDIFSKCYYDSYSKESLQISLELNERLDDIQSILNWSLNRDAPVEQYHQSNNINNEGTLASSSDVPKLDDDLPNYELPPEELVWLNEWLSGKEMVLDTIFENNQIRENFASVSADSYDCNSGIQAERGIDWNEASIAPMELYEDCSNFMKSNISLSDKEKDEILKNDELVETLMKEIDEIDATDLLRSDEELTEIMLSALVDETYPSSQESVNAMAPEEAEPFFNTAEDINEKQSEEAAGYLNDNNNNDKDVEEIRIEPYSSSGSHRDEELEYVVDSSEDSTDCSEAPKTSFAYEIDSDSSANDEEQKNHRPAAPLRKLKRKMSQEPKKELHECSLCPIPLRFRYSRTLKLHMEAAHKGLYNLVCETCGRRFNKQYTYNRHVGSCRWVKQRFRCQECGKDYRHKSSLVAHKRTKHETDKKMTSPKHETDKKMTSSKHVCDVCLKTFKSTIWYNNHMRTHKND